MIAGQNKYWGRNIEESIKLWTNLDVKHLMIKETKDINLIKPDGKINTETFKKLGKLQDEYDIKFHVHPYRVSVQVQQGEIFLDMLSEYARKIYKNILQEMDKQIQINGLYPLIDLHLTTLDDPKLGHKQSENEGIKAGKEFFQDLELESKIALETMHDPYRNPGFSLLGYKAKHFSEIIKDKKNIGICIDTGHLFMANEPLNNFLNLPYPILSIHYNGCDGKTDSHHMPNKNNIKEPEKIEKLLKIEGPVVLEIRNYNYSEKAMKKLIENTKAGKIV